MKLPQWLYHAEKTNEMEHTSISTGEIDCESLIQGNANFWLKPGKVELRPKKMVFCDFTVAGWPKYKKYILRDIFETFLKSKFQLFTCLTGIVEPLSSNVSDCFYLGCDIYQNIFSKEDFPEFAITSSEDIFTQMATLGISSDEIVILDYFTVRRLISEYTQGSIIAAEDIRSVDIRDLITCTNSVDVMLNYFIKENLKDFIKSDYAEDAILYHEIQKTGVIEEKFEKAGIKYRIKESECILTGDIEGADISAAKIICFNEGVSKERLIDALEKVSALREIELSSWALTPIEMQKLSPKLRNTLHKVVALTINNFEIDISMLFAILNEMPNLKSLVFNKSTLRGLDTQFTPNYFGNALNNLEMLQISDSFLPGSFIGAILDRNRASIQVLKLRNEKYDRIKFSLFESSFLRLQNITAISIFNASVTYNMYAAMFSQFSCLQMLCLENVDQPDEDNLFKLSNAMIHLPRLEKICINYNGHTTILDAFPIEFFRNTPRLQIAHLISHFISNNYQAFNLEAPIFKSKSLAKIKLKNFSFPASILAELMQQSSLRYLALNKCEIYGHAGLTNFPTLPLINLYCESSSIPPMLIASLLKQSPALKKIALFLNNEISELAYKEIYSELVKLQQLIVLRSNLNIPLEVAHAILLANKKMDNFLLNDNVIDSDAMEQDPRFTNYKDVLAIDYFTLPGEEEKKEDLDDELASDEPRETERESSSGFDFLSEAQDSELSTWECDANTTLKPTNHRIKRVFFAKDAKNHPSVRELRENIHFDLEIRDEVLEGQNPFILKKREPQLIAKKYFWSTSLRHLEEEWKTSITEDSETYYGTIELKLSNNWQSLPSLSPRERLTQLFVEGMSENDIELKYCEEENLYYIRKPTVTNHFLKSTIHFLVDVPQLEPKKLPDELRTKIDEYNAYNTNTLEITPGMTGHDYLQAIKTQHTGSCRHRSVAFLSDLLIEYPMLKKRLVRNKCHAYIEIFIETQYEGEWVSCDLGGYPGTLELLEDRPRYHFVDEVSFAPPKYFVTWKKQDTTKEINIRKLLQVLTNETGKNVLINAPSENITNSFHLLLQRSLLKRQRPFYYLHDPQDLVCSANWIAHHEDNTGQIMPGPGGPLHVFLQENAHLSPVLIVNFNRFKADDIVKFNSLLNDERFIDGTAVPTKALVIALYDIYAAGAYEGSDFYSRMDKIYTDSFNLQELEAFCRTLRNITSDNIACEPIEIDLFMSPDWRQRLLGRWMLKGDQFLFEEGLLIKALKQSNAIHIKNGPWHLEAFTLFWQQALLQRKVVIGNRSLFLPDTFSLGESRGYDWKNLISCVHWYESEAFFSGDVYVLNPSSFNKFFRNYRSLNGKLFACPGWLEQNRGKKIEVEWTRDLYTQDQWAQLLTIAKENQVTFCIRAQSNDDLNNTFSLNTNRKTINLCNRTPASIDFWQLFSDFVQKEADSFHLELQNSPELNIAQSFSRARTNEAQIIITPDIDLKVAVLLKDRDALVIDVSELNATDVMVKQDINWSDDNLTFNIELIISDVWEFLQSGKRVILKGSFSPELVDELAPLCIRNGVLSTLTKSNDFGELILITDNIQTFSGLPITTFPNDNALKRRKLIEQFGEDLVNQIPAVFFNKCTYVCLQTWIRHQQTYPGQNGDKSWYGLEFLPSHSNHYQSPMDLSLSASERFERERLTQLLKAMDVAPYVFIGGATGIGKSTFIQTVLAHHENFTVYEGESKIFDWASDQSPETTKVLFIDEANIGQSNYSLFEGLFNQPPQILLNQKLYTLTAQHKVVFAGNPLSYGGERSLPTLFRRHGNSIIFDPLPTAYLYHKVLKPIFEDILGEDIAEDISRIILEAYQYTLLLNRKEVVITPRELQMIAFLIVSKNITDKDIIKTTYESIRTICKNVLDETKQKALERWLAGRHHFEANTPKPLRVKKIGNFILTPSHTEAYLQLNGLLEVRKFQQNGNSEAKCFGGLSGMVIEGEPGNGKSHFVLDMMVHHGFREIHPHNKQAVSGDIFYRLPLAMSPKEKQRLLLKAFNEGAVVIIDEINSCPMMEKLMNSLLMGRDLEGNRPLVPGFKIIGTQNPITYAGRKPISLALKRRLMHCKFVDYPAHELIDILIEKGLHQKVAKKWVLEFIRAREYATKHQLKPVPNFRDLMKFVNRFLNRKKRMRKVEGEFAKRYHKRLEEYLACLMQKNKKFACRKMLSTHEKGGGKKYYPLKTCKVLCYSYQNAQVKALQNKKNRGTNLRKVRV
ncbi:MAG: hypothetical protein BGO43_00545 [Gammaproteobacteria bacterium 39-13]|nr:AAA family ATPase [Gammaproteobacteria bacterium]OJV96746.1 MAG: hypothetical protein BGO43_00545 [Gammaproteobacteria bacterium 39-13]